LIEIGSHAVTHVPLPTLTQHEQRAEILQSKAYLKEALGYIVTGFCYPYGVYTEETMALVRDGRFTYACTTKPGSIGHKADLWQLPRVAVEDWDGEEFSKRLSMWFAG
jgi:peptidoglycan/xylan/chitin deacetylase (PgdA/CDA1 family)